MSEHLRESVSALMDGEADQLELRRLLATENSDKVNDSWSRYHLIRDALHNTEQATEFHRWDISEQITKAIAEETSATEQADQASSWWKPVAGFAVSASVAVAVVFGVQMAGQSNAGFEANALAASPQPVISSRAYPLQSVSMQASSAGAVSSSPVGLPGAAVVSKTAAELEMQKQLEKYMLRYTEGAALNNGQGVVSYVRLANPEEQ